MGAKKSISSIRKICKATNGIKDIVKNFDNDIQIHKTSSKHSTRDSINDEKEMITDLFMLDPFTYMLGRNHNSFPNIKRAPSLYLNIVEHHKWLNEHIKQLSPYEIVNCTSINNPKKHI